MHIALIDYPFSLKSAIYGLDEMLFMANEVASLSGERGNFVTSLLKAEDLNAMDKNQYDYVFIPPAQVSRYYLKPGDNFLLWLQKQSQNGAVICSACAGAFIVAAAGLVHSRTITTHWGLVEQFQEHFPEIDVDAAKILINETDIITAGGMMSWVDLGLELIRIIASENTMRQVGKNLVIDTAPREQSYYSQFKPSTAHTDDLIIQVQRYIHEHYATDLKISALAQLFHIAERTLLRRFSAATGYKPRDYITHFRIQKCCDLLESTQTSFESIAYLSGYEDVSTCRKAFNKIMGLSPRAFRKRFSLS